MTKDEALKMCLEYIETNAQGSKFAILIKEALAQSEPEYVAFMDVPQRTWVGLTDEEVEGYWDWEDFQCGCGQGTLFEMVRAIEAKLKEKNNA